MLPENDWLIFNTQSTLGASLAAQGRFAEAEPLLLEGHTGLHDHADTIPERVRDARIDRALQRVIDLYDEWGKTEVAAEWRAKRPEDAIVSRPKAG